MLFSDYGFRGANNTSPDSTLRVKEYDRVRKRLEKLYFDHGIMDSRPFTAPILKHHSECGHEDEDGGFDADVLDKMKETLEWGKDVTQAQLHLAAAAKIDTPERRRAQSSTSSQMRSQLPSFEKQTKSETLATPLRQSSGPDVIMIDD